MFDWVFSVMRQVFQLFFDFMNAVELREGVTFWSLLLVFLIGGGIATAVVQHIGGASLASAGVAAYDDYKNTLAANEREAARVARAEQVKSERESRERARAAEQARRETYDYYKEKRSRSERYSARYLKEKEEARKNRS